MYRLVPIALLIGAVTACSDDSQGNDSDGQVNGDASVPDAQTVDSGVDSGPIEGACVTGEAVPAAGCICDDIPYTSGWCCSGGWQPFACDYPHTTCQDLGVPNCVEVWPDEQRTGYEFDATHRVYFFRDLSNADHYFLLMGDITCASTCTVFGFDDGNPDQDAKTTFDLNGYTVRYSADSYAQLPNNGFELWTGSAPQDWTVSGGTVEQRSTDYWMPMHGDYVLYADGAVTLESSPAAVPRGRLYRGYVTVGRAEDTDITLDVLDDQDNVVCSDTQPGYFRGQSIACEFVAAAAGSYRLRLTTSGYAYFDRTGIVPLGDYGVAVLTAWSLSESNNNQDPIVQNLTGLDIPATGDHANPDRYNHLEVKSGFLVAEHENQRSEGVHLSGIVRLELHHAVIRAQGLKSHTLRAAGVINDNYLEVDMPWYFARENSDEENVILRGGEFYNNTAVGGQGVIRLGGSGTQVHHNYLRNNAQATNHYAIIHSGAENPEIHHNTFDPIEGSGILTYTGHGYRIHDNVFYVTTATCNVEYLNEDYSTNGIRLNDYGAETNYDNLVYNNVFYILGLDFDTAWESCMPVTTGIFYSASGAGNRIYDNTFEVIKTHDNADAPCYALYVGGDAYNNPADNPLFVGNRFETNDKAVWITTFYGDSRDIWLENNTFVRLVNEHYTPAVPEAPIRLGYWNRHADGLRLINNHFEGGFTPGAYQFTATSDSALYDLHLQWYLNVTVHDSAANPVPNATVRAVSISGTGPTAESVEGTTDANGVASLTVTQYLETGDLRPDGTHDRAPVTPHRVEVEVSGGHTGQVSSVDVTDETDVTVTIDTL